MQDLTKNLVTGALAMGTSGSQAVSAELPKSQSRTPDTSFSEALGSAVVEKQSQTLEGQQSTVDLEADISQLALSDSLLAKSGEVFPPERQEVPVVTANILKSNQQQDQTVQGLVESSINTVSVALEEVNEKILVNSIQILAQEKFNDARTSFSASLNGTVADGLQQQIRSQFTPFSMNGEKNANLNAPIITGSSLFEEPLSLMPNSAKLLDGQLQVKGEFFGDVKLIANDLSLSVQNLSTSRSGAGEPSASLGVITPQNIEKPVGLAEIKAPINSPEWKSDLGERVVWMAQNKIPAAEIKINPAHLGPIEIKISLNNEQATVSMIASHGATREALEAAIPRLKEAFSDSGLQLADADVSSSHSDSGQDEHQKNEFADAMKGSPQSEQADDATDESRVTSISHIQNTGVDIFA
ncbi:MAG: hypothetical protein GXP14_07190 [Gammaproteobacteria bacterium]|nr:hypothetical protein [Gammaproteobacteria bacterium]